MKSCRRIFEKNVSKYAWAKSLKILFETNLWTESLENNIWTKSLTSKQSLWSVFDHIFEQHLRKIFEQGDAVFLVVIQRRSQNIWGAAISSSLAWSQFWASLCGPLREAVKWSEVNRLLSCFKAAEADVESFRRFFLNFGLKAWIWFWPANRGMHEVSELRLIRDLVWRPAYSARMESSLECSHGMFSWSEFVRHAHFLFFV